MRRSWALYVICVTQLLCASPSLAWKSDYKWNKRVVSYRVNAANKHVSKAKALAAIRKGAEAWTKQTKAAFRFDYGGSSSATTHGHDGVNLVLFRDAKKSSSSTARATTYKWMVNGAIVDADIVFWGKAASFITQGTACSGDVYIENVAIHEFGHALGLEHTSVSAATMFATSSACAQNRLTLEGDDQRGAEALYPCSQASHCNDLDLCTKDSCQGGKCNRNTIANCCKKAADCGDGDVCTKDACDANNRCTHNPIANCCKKAADCGDGDVCTKDACDAKNRCTHSPIPGCGVVDAGPPPDSAPSEADGGASPVDGPSTPDSRPVGDGPSDGSSDGAGDDGLVDGEVREESPKEHLAGGCAVTDLDLGPGRGDLVALVMLALIALRRAHDAG